MASSGRVSASAMTRLVMRRRGPRPRRGRSARPRRCRPRRSVISIENRLVVSRVPLPQAPCTGFADPIRVLMHGLGVAAHHAGRARCRRQPERCWRTQAAVPNALHEVLLREFRDREPAGAVAAEAAGVRLRAAGRLPAAVAAVHDVDGRAGRRGEVVVGRGRGRELDRGVAELERGAGRALGEHLDPQRHAVLRVDRDRHLADQRAVVLGGEDELVAGLARHHDVGLDRDHGGLADRLEQLVGGLLGGERRAREL